MSSSTSQSRRSIRARLAVVAALGTAVVPVAACSGGVDGTTQTADPGVTTFKHDTGPRAPAVTGSQVGGGKLTLSYGGHVTVLNFWGSWCASCREEAPSLAAAAHRFKPAGVQFTGVDIEDNSASAQAFMTTYRISYPSFNDPGDTIALNFRDAVPPQAIPAPSSSLEQDGSPRGS